MARIPRGAARFRIDASRRHAHEVVVRGDDREEDVDEDDADDRARALGARGAAMRRRSHGPVRRPHQAALRLSCGHAVPLPAASRSALSVERGALARDPRARAPSARLPQLPASEASTTCAAVSAVTICGPVRTTRSTLPSGKRTGLQVLREEHDRQVALQVLRLVDGEQHVARRRSPASTSGDRSNVAKVMLAEHCRLPSSAASVGVAPGRPERQDAVDVRVVLQRPGHRLGGAGRVVQVDRRSLRPGSAEALEEPLAAQVEGGVADLLVDADRVLDARLGEPLPGDQARPRTRSARRARARRGRRRRPIPSSSR